MRLRAGRRRRGKKAREMSREARLKHSVEGHRVGLWVRRVRLQAARECLRVGHLGHCREKAIHSVAAQRHAGGGGVVCKRKGLHWRVRERVGEDSSQVWKEG